MSQSVPLYQRPKPRLRGRLHEIAFFVAIPAGVVLIVLAPGPIARAGAIVYWLALLSQFGVSASYHLGKWSERAHERMRRLDHSTIFLLIAGTYTPFCLLALDGTASLVLLAVVWIGAAAGIVTKLFRTDLNVLSGFLYIGLGWVAIFAMPSLVHALTTAELVLLISGGCCTRSARWCWPPSGPTPSREPSGSTRSGTAPRSPRRRVCSPRSCCSASAEPSRRRLEPSGRLTGSARSG